MAHFHYKARSSRGEFLEGELEAASADAVASQLMDNGITPIDIREKAASGGGLDLSNLQLWERRVSLDELVMFSRQMYTLTRAGVPIIRAMKGLAETAKSTRLKRVLGEITESLESGRALGESLRAHPDVFNSLYVSIIQVGENSGRLEEAFLQIARHLELDKETRERVKTALRYPLMVFVAITAAMFIINLKVIPAFAGVFASFDADLPWATRLLIGTSNFFLAYWVHISVLLVAAVAGLIWYVRTESGEYRWDRYKLRLPVVGNLILRATLARFARSFALSMRSGVPLIQALTVVARAVDNAYVAARVLTMRNGIERGESLTRTAVTSDMFTPLVLQMLAVGEETGRVDDMMQEVAEFYEREVDYDLKRLSAYIEPIMIIAIGIMVLVLALGVFLPMWDLASAARN
ncbi:type II secretion system F family protein [Alkalilimnicola sp. S0819]|uniref:type II secretion system F family protein n=1 Tax=Alkalilimnicola sp. S0819 TaxID=2613922 RepID=UPI001261AFF6|nr:type II secretion system F family protein [Alkalilimnicola sp. S0819]KAB7622637.1 type II secretion system F family protein [Alkalilimnicola sp. S0819]MPQ17408.1 type II secretion system F family protein [Alkalilimnicola sp. S0819]